MLLCVMSLSYSGFLREEVTPSVFAFGRPATAAFDSGCASERKIDIEVTRTAVRLSRHCALRYRHRGRHSHVINILFVVKRGSVGNVASRVVRNNGDVIAYLVLVWITDERIERIAHGDVRRPRNAAVQ